MILYHFTSANRLPTIKRKGLVPQRGDHMTSGIDRVWLTTQPDLSVTPRESEWLAKHGGLNVMEFDGEGFKPPRTWFLTHSLIRKRVGRHWVHEYRERKPLRRITVNVRKNDHKLHRYTTWAGRPRDDIQDHRSATFARLWYVFLGTIPPEQILSIDS